MERHEPEFNIPDGVVYTSPAPPPGVVFPELDFSEADATDKVVEFIGLMEQQPQYQAFVECNADHARITWRNASHTCPFRHFWTTGELGPYPPQDGHAYYYSVSTDL